MRKRTKSKAAVDSSLAKRYCCIVDWNAGKSLAGKRLISTSCYGARGLAHLAGFSYLALR
jgi:hypothetical protein